MATEPAEHDEETIVERIGKGLGIDPDGDGHDPLELDRGYRKLQIQYSSQLSCTQSFRCSFYCCFF